MEVCVFEKIPQFRARPKYIIICDGVPVYIAKSQRQAAQVAMYLRGFINSDKVKDKELIKLRKRVVTCHA